MDWFGFVAVGQIDVECKHLELTKDSMFLVGHANLDRHLVLKYSRQDQVADCWGLVGDIWKENAWDLQLPYHEKSTGLYNCDIVMLS